MKTSTGFEFTVPEGVADDMELLDALIDIDDGNLSGLRKAMTMLLGEDQRKALYEHCRSKTGRVSASAVLGAFKEILEAMGGEVKNS